MREKAAELEAWEKKAYRLLAADLTDKEKIKRFDDFILPMAREYLQGIINDDRSHHTKACMIDAVLAAAFGHENLHTAFGNDRP